MGSNIGTSVTNTLVSVGQAIDRAQFRRAFAGATVHDMFNWLTVFVLLPVEWISGDVTGRLYNIVEFVIAVGSIGNWKDCGLLCQLTGAMTDTLKVVETTTTGEPEMLQVITKPLTNLIIQMDKDILVQLAQQGDNVTDDDSVSLVKHWCKEKGQLPLAYLNPVNNTCQLRYIDVQVNVRCVHMMEHISKTWSDTAVGACLLLFSLSLLIFCLVSMVKLLNSMLKGAVAQVIQKVLNSDFPHPFGFLTGYVAMLVGVGMTMILQSSSIFTSALTPLVGAGVLHIERMFPLTLGSNIGTTFTAVLAALSASRDIFQVTMQVALCHLFFNVIGILIWYPVPVMRRVPIALAKKLGHTTASHRWFAIVYIAFMFFLAPAAIFAMSILGWAVLLAVLCPIVIAICAVSIISCIQKRRPSILPAILRSWVFLPLWLRSLDPYDSWMEKLQQLVVTRLPCCRPSDESTPVSLEKEMDHIAEDSLGDVKFTHLTTL